VPQQGRERDEVNVLLVAFGGGRLVQVDEFRQQVGEEALTVQKLSLGDSSAGERFFTCKSGRSAYPDDRRVLLAEHAVLLLCNRAKTRGCDGSKLGVLEEREQVLNHGIAALI
jgi:hypothetical protein